MSNESSPDEQIAALETTLQLPGLPDAVRSVAEAQLRALRERRVTPPAAAGAASVAGNATVYGAVVGVNHGVIQAFYGVAPPADAKQQLDAYLRAMVREHGRLRLGKLLANEQTGREEPSAPSLSLRAVYTSLATDVWLRGETFRQNPKSMITALDRVDLATLLPEDAQIPVTGAAQVSGGLTVKLAVYGGSLAEVLARMRATYHVSTGSMYGAWYRPELAVEAVASEARVVLLGAPGSGKSTVLRYLVVSLAEALLAGTPAGDVRGWERVDPLPVPLFCQLGRVAKKLSDDPEQDNDALVAELLRPVTGGALRAGLDMAILSAWQRGGALLCLDGLDEVSGVPERTLAGQRSKRERVAAAIRWLADQVGASRIVVTCRTRPYEQSAAWQLRDDWQVRRLEPFTISQVRRFVPAWYAQTCGTPNAKYTLDEARERGERLVAVLADRTNLAGLTSLPLLLTMLVLLHYNRKQLPDERADVYEEMVALLLERWEGVRSADQDQRVESVGERLGLPQLTASDLRPVIHEIAFVAHQQAVDGRGVLSRPLMEQRLDAFFALKISPANPKAAPRARCAAASDAFVTLLREETGLLQEEDDDTYVLPHLTFEEYLAACHLAGREDVDLAYQQWVAGSDRWREPVLLLMGRLRKQEKLTQAYAWLSLLASERVGVTLKERVQRQRDALLAMACYDELGRRVAFVGSSHDVLALEQRLREALVALLGDTAQPLTTAERVRAGFALGDLGDPRIPVTVDDWRHEVAKARSGDATGYLCRVEAGTYLIGSGDDDPDAQEEEKPRHQVTFDKPFWIARYPVTNAQWQAWVMAVGEGAGTANASDLNRQNQPVVRISWDLASSYCAWLSAQIGAEVRLPSEVEWEASARGPAGRRYPWGSEWQHDRAVTADDREARGWQGGAPVGCYPAGAALETGALDMVGNVWEWTADVWQSYPGAEKPFVELNRRSLRGGGRDNDSTRARCAARGWGLSYGRYDNYGFRVAISLDTGIDVDA